MRTRHALELAVGIGLLLGPLAYALTLTSEMVHECSPLEASAVDPRMSIEIVEPAELEPVERREQPEPVAVPIEIEPTPETEVDLESERMPFMFVTDVGVVLSTEAKSSWATGRLFEPRGTATHRAAKRADASAIPAEFWAQRGREFDVYGADGKVCTARLGELRVVAQYEGYGVAGILGNEWHDRDPAEASTAEIREGLWKRGALWLVASLESDERCKGALWIRDAALPAPTILRRSSEPTPASEARIRAFEASEELAETERSYRNTYAEFFADDPSFSQYTPNWATLVANQGVTAWSWLDPNQEVQLVGYDFGPEPADCGDPFDAKLTGLDQVHGEEFIELLHGSDPVAIFDADLDAKYEFFYRYDDGSRTLVSDTLRAFTSIERDWYCPC